MRNEDLLNKYYDVDAKEKVVTFHLCYENRDELLTKTFKDKYRFSKDVIYEIYSQLNKDIPKAYKLNMDINIKEKTESQMIVESFYDELGFIDYQNKNKNRHKYLIVALLFLFGLILLVFNIYATNNDVFNFQVFGNMLSWIIDTLACVLVWEAFTFVFLLYYEDNINVCKLIKRINKIIVNKKDIFYPDKKVHRSIDLSNISEIILLLCGVLVFVEAFYDILILLFESIPLNNTFITVASVLMIIYEIVLASGAILKYLGVDNLFVRLLKYFIIIDILFNVFGIIFGSVTYSLFGIYDILFIISLFLNKNINGKK